MSKKMRLHPDNLVSVRLPDRAGSRPMGVRLEIRPGQIRDLAVVTLYSILIACLCNMP